ncbi:hypothetical protein Srubr_28150 [Streptomyces rubradiris]|uniref:Uncharacterized protein n=1 Tax=Streptomyces rubradiris TaxID=285531 RepID=A0ABQ3RAS7_STRRR|nr:hypothetical protein GCM10018792_51030 [Streptomyces rubradiris]GHI52969.1 hypothetical protein Srubr_28150 [Streptomyces rubradiris]
MRAGWGRLVSMGFDVIVIPCALHKWNRGFRVRMTRGSGEEDLARRPKTTAGTVGADFRSLTPGSLSLLPGGNVLTCATASAWHTDCGPRCAGCGVGLANTTD